MSGNVISLGNAVFEKDSTARLELFADLILGYNLREGSNAETYLKMHKNSALNVTGVFRAFFNSSIEIWENGELTLGKSYINSNSVIACAEKITIGDNCAIARNVFIYDSDHHTFITEEKAQKKSAPITICDRVWIGVNSVILKGVTIGEGAVIGAGSVVTKSVPPGCLAVGNPARVIKEGVVWK